LIFVAPDGLNGGWGNSNGEDLQLVDDMVKLIEDNYCVDTTHLFAQGVAWGGGMTYAIACARAKVFRGVAIYEGAQFSGCDNGNDPLAYWQMVGLTDNAFTIDMARPMHHPPDRAAPASSASSLFDPRRACLHRLHRLLKQASPALVRAPVRSRQWRRGWNQ
jgi:poly(3-hydroxybutyrate) depolymerase